MDDRILRLCAVFAEFDPEIVEAGAESGEFFFLLIFLCRKKKSKSRCVHNKLRIAAELSVARREGSRFTESAPTHTVLDARLFFWRARARARHFGLIAARSGAFLESNSIARVMSPSRADEQFASVGVACILSHTHTDLCRDPSRFSLALFKITPARHF